MEVDEELSVQFARHVRVCMLSLPTVLPIQQYKREPTKMDSGVTGHSKPRKGYAKPKEPTQNQRKA